jgi:hypothetical protein
MTVHSWNRAIWRQQWGRVAGGGESRVVHATRVRNINQWTKDNIGNLMTDLVLCYPNLRGLSCRKGLRLMGPRRYRIFYGMRECCLKHFEQESRIPSRRLLDYA